MENVKKLSKTINEMQQKISEIRKESLHLRTEIEVLQQESRSVVPEKRNENIVSMVKKIGSIVGTIIHDDDIAASHRVARFNKGSDTSNNYPKNVIVKFFSVSKRNEFLSAVKLGRNRGLKASDLGFEQETRLFVNEHLSSYFKQLHRRAREFCKMSNYIYCWIKDSKIFIKKEDNSRAFHVSNEQVLSSLST
ncbi:uncharacterized protein LOC126743207 [Anthonomus grandis grandis]|uniref:uncharacterized protein LOC126743207 n=1 Tax=Anthonomus grandis grandis TaxID=2921223 RepID=UPI0021654974|nr:uncharacterized protein LOC126743207 [Anthonomus grandis grandis]